MTDTNDQMNDTDSGQQAQGPPGQLPELSVIDALSGKIIELENSVKQYKDQLLRKAAEFENYKKRTDNDYSAIIKFSNEELIMKLLPVLDDFERSMKAMQKSIDESGQSKDATAFVKGMELIYSKLRNIMEKEGIKHFEVVGKPFDPQMHDALLQLPRNDVPPHTVIEEVEKGYLMHDKVIRHAKVVVSVDEHVDGDPSNPPGNGGVN
jgi:molecular chaperone GrpE